MELDVSSESSAMKNQALFSLRDKSKEIRMSTAAGFLFGTLRVNSTLPIPLMSMR